ncbi:hypothetical protein AALP_AAs72757U000100 [Arabis alpina]|uniref:Uncharacterized protein n=1 Tax=Arabis alpina TaxID=50452 RepID=A0A087G0A1_ARAAL|nr:hypothetical protein AALP_AAs72757U000100 [Arabis alpina]
MVTEEAPNRRGPAFLPRPPIISLPERHVRASVRWMFSMQPPLLLSSITHIALKKFKAYQGELDCRSEPRGLEALAEALD